METPATEGVDTAAGPTTEFETAQRHLFDAVGLDTRSRFVDLEDLGVRTHVVEAGPVSDEPPLLFVHGTAAFAGIFAPLMGQFDDVRTIAFDRPGYGLSDEYVYHEGTVRQSILAALVGVLDELGVERVDLVGHSMGGHAAILFALTHPERVRRLVTLGALPAFPGTQPPFPLRLMTVPLLGRFLQRLQKPDEAGVLDVAELFGERESIQEYPALIRAMAAHERDPKAATAGMSEFRSLFSIRGWHQSVRLREAELGALQCPPTVIWGENDPLGGPDDVRHAVDSITDVRFETVDSGHIPYLAHPRRCARLIRAARDREGDQ